MSVRILIDSTADIPEDKKKDFTVVPLTIRFGEEEFTDGIDIDKKRFYEKLIESDVLPKTSQATPHTFERFFQEAADAGDDVVALIVSSSLSGSYQSAMIAAENYPNRVFVVDTKNVAIGSAILAESALRMKNEGATAREIATAMEKERENVRLIALLDTLEYLKKGGRISSTVAFAGELLSIKPVICIENGAVKILGKARGSKQGNNFLVREIQNCGGVDFEKPVLLGYTGFHDDLLRKYVNDSRFLWEEAGAEPKSSCIGSVVGAHVGPGAIAVAFFKKS